MRTEEVGSAGTWSIDAHLTQSISVRITNEPGELDFISTSTYNVITRDNPSVVEVIAEPVG